MTDVKHIIEPERMGLWVAVTFIIALLALAVSLIGLMRTAELGVVTQAEFLALTNKMQNAEPAAEAAPAPEAAPEEAN